MRRTDDGSGKVRRAVGRSVCLAGVAVVGVAGSGAAAGATPLRAPAHRSPTSGDPGSAGEFATPATPERHGPVEPGTAERPPRPPSAPEPSTPSGGPSFLTRSSHGTPHSRTATPTPSDTATPSPSDSPSASSSSGRRDVRLHVAITGVRMTGHGTGVRYAVRVRATGGAARHTTATIAVRPHGKAIASPGACHGHATVRCRLGDLRKGHTLTFRRHVGNAHRVTIDVTADAANAPTAGATTVVVVHRRTRHPGHHTAHHTAPHYVPPRTVTVRRPLPVTPPRVAAAPQAPAAPAAPAAPPSTIVATPPGAGMPGPAGQNLAANTRPRLPVVAPRPGPQPTPNGAPVTVRPVADGHRIAGDAAGPPTRTILGLLAAAASFVGLVTAFVLIRRRNE